jgi:regulatory protein
MKKITNLKHQIKNSNRVSVFVDGEYSFGLTVDQILNFKLKKGDLLDDKDIKNYKKQSEVGKLKQKSLEWLMLRPHSTQEFINYTYRKKIDEDLTEAWIKEFTVKKYLNDENFARWFSDQRLRKNESLRAISAKLRSKGISQTIISDVLGDIYTSDIETIKKLIKKVGSRPRYKDPQKLMAYLVTKGFHYGDIKEAMSKKN